MVAIPDVRTVVPLDWRADEAAVVADLETVDGEPFPLSGCSALRRVVADLGAEGYTSKAGIEVEFSLLAPGLDGWMPLSRRSSYELEALEEAAAFIDDLTAFDEEDSSASAREGRRAQAALCLEGLVRAGYEAEEVTQFAEKYQERVGLLTDVRHGARGRLSEQSRRIGSARAGSDVESFQRAPVGSRSPHSRDTLDDGSDTGTLGTRPVRSANVSTGRGAIKITSRDIYT